MALPEPKSEETREQFIRRCTTDIEVKNLHPESGHRFAFCQFRWENTQPILVEPEFVDMVSKNDMPRSLYVCRPVINADEIIRWAKSQGFSSAFPPEALHVTIAYSKRPVDWFALPRTSQSAHIPAGGARTIEIVGGDTAVLRFQSEQLSRRHQQIIEHGASWDYPEYLPHISITMNLKGVDIKSVKPYAGPITLGVERFEDITSGSNESVTEKFDFTAQISKVDADKQLAYGWASVIEKDGKAVVDLHNDVISEETLIKAAHQYIMDSRAGKVMHQGKRVADMVESIVFTKDIQKSLGIDLGQIGWFVGMKVRDEKVWEAVKSGKLPMFSIGGVARRGRI